MRIRVMVDVRTPLKKERKVKLQGGDWNTLNFKYERLCMFCFRYGLMGHSDTDLRFTVAVDDGVRGYSMAALLIGLVEIALGFRIQRQLQAKILESRLLKIRERMTMPSGSISWLQQIRGMLILRAIRVGEISCNQISRHADPLVPLRKEY